MRNFIFLLTAATVINMTSVPADISNVDMKAQYIADAVQYEAELLEEEINTEELEHEEPMNESQVVQVPPERYLGTFEATAYCACASCCGACTGITASGAVATQGRTIAVDPNVIPMGAKVKVVYSNGSSATYVAEDTGGAIKGNIIDVYFASHQEAWNFGRQHVEVYILE